MYPDYTSCVMGYKQTPAQMVHKTWKDLDKTQIGVFSLHICCLLF